VFEKLDAYDIIANLVPGAALTYALHCSNFSGPSPDDLGAFLLVAFIVGVTTNRIGSIVLDPLLRAVRFLKPKDYDAFVSAEKQDAKLEILVANHGLYRTFFAAGFLYLAALILRSIFPRIGHSSSLLLVLCVAVGMVVFAFALRKEDNYIRTRIANANKS
jgi:hypothetical protein